jgi:colanic acid/amylovoran biosynthesis glycosyltransferase
MAQVVVLGKYLTSNHPNDHPNDQLHNHPNDYPMKIAHFVRSFSPTSETFIYDYITKNPLVEQRVFSFQRVNENNRPFAHVTCLPPQKNLWTWLSQKLFPTWHGEHQSTIDRLTQAMDLEKVDVIHAHFGPNAVIMLDCALKLKKPLIASFHGYDISSFLRQKIWLDRYQTLFKSVHAITVVSRYQKQILIDLGVQSDRIHVVRVGKDLQEFQYQPVSKPVRNLISVGRLVEKKGFLDLVSAFAILKSKNQLGDLQLKIIGGGEIFDRIAQEIKKNQLENVIHLLGEQPHHVVKTELRQSDAFILCSKTADNGDQEGIPTVFMEAQSLGLPCVATKHVGIPEVFPAQSQAFLAQEGNVEEIASAILKLSQCSVEELQIISQAGRTHIENEFALDDQIQALNYLYQQLHEQNH